MTAISIGELSRRTEVNIETIRYYERTGVLPPPPRTGGGHRVYAEDHLKRLSFVRRSRELGFGLDSIKEMLQMVDARDVSCEQVRGIAKGHLDNVRDKITDLERMEKTLSATVSLCDGGETPECPILDTLFLD